MASKKDTAESTKIKGTVTRVADGKVFFRPDDLAVVRNLNLSDSNKSHRAGHDEIAVRTDDEYKVGDEDSFDVA